MSEEPKPCPNPKCKSDDVEAAYPERGRSHVFCGDCGMRGPSVKCDDPSDDVEVTMAKAEAAWNALPREGDPAPATTDVLIYPFDGMAKRVSQFQAILNASGNAPAVEAAMLKMLYRQLFGDSNESAFAAFDADIDAYLGLKPNPPTGEVEAR